MGHAGNVERAAGLLRVWVGTHTDHHHRMAGDGVLHLADDRGFVAGHLLPHGGMDRGLFKNGAWHVWSHWLLGGQA